MAGRGLEVCDWDDSDWEQASISHSEVECHAASDVGYDTDSSAWLILSNDDGGDDDEYDDGDEDSGPLSGSANESSRPHVDPQPVATQIASCSAKAASLADSTCMHYHENNCQLTGAPHRRWCCACLDRRPHAHSGLYEAYVDGKGWAASARRWEYYCPGCKTAGGLAAQTDPQAGHTASESTIMIEGKSIAKVSSRKEASAPADMRSASSGITTADIAKAHAMMFPDEDTPATPSVALFNTQPRQSQRRPQLQTQIKPTLLPPPRVHNFNITPTQRSLLHQTTRCKHWVERTCQLTSTRGKCCQCSDIRDHADDSGTRVCAYYCPACKGSIMSGHSVMAGILVLRDRRGGGHLMHWEIEARRKEREDRNRWRRQDNNPSTTTPSQDNNTSFPFPVPVAPRREAIRNQQRKKQAQHGTTTMPNTEPAVAKGCVHWSVRSCALSAKEQYCCACMDARDDRAAAYLKYVDGQGDILAATRWEYYCPGCRKAGAESEGRGADDKIQYVDWAKRGARKAKRAAMIMEGYQGLP